MNKGRLKLGFFFKSEGGFEILGSSRVFKAFLQVYDGNDIIWMRV